MADAVLILAQGVLAEAKHLSYLIILRYDSVLRKNFKWDQFPEDTTFGGKFRHHPRAAFERNFILLPGEKDVNEDDANHSRTSEALEQGNKRFERGNNFYASVKNEASRVRIGLGMDSMIRIRKGGFNRSRE